MQSLLQSSVLECLPQSFDPEHHDVGILLSGGVDSSVALRRLQSAGVRRITAYYLKIWLEEELAFLGDCPWEDDLNVVREVCRQANVPLEVVSLQQEYHERVVDYTIDELKQGRTPSPDILCNSRIKFGAFYEKIRTSHRWVATGHYAGSFEDQGIYYLQQGNDPIKDQTYFLSHITQEQLSGILFPLAGLPKHMVRQLAQDFALPNASRKDSQGLCFLGKIKFRDFAKFHLGSKTGPIVERKSGKRLGTHQGYWLHTIGQRKGLGLSGGPWFVVAKDTASNTVFVSHEADMISDVLCDSFFIPKPHWISRLPQKDRIHVKIRHGAHSYPCTLYSDGDQGSLRVVMDSGDRGVAAGQFAVFYEGTTCLGGGIISTH